MSNETKNDKEQKIALFIGAITLIIAILGAAYAYFQISTDANNSNTTITGNTPANGLVTLKGITNNIHLDIIVNDMALGNVNKEYYGAKEEGKPYENNEIDGTHTIAEVELTGGEEIKYRCTAKLTVSKGDTDTMVEVLQPEDMILQLKGNIINEKLDLSELKENNPKEYNLDFTISTNKSENIEAYIKLLNKKGNQNYLSEGKLNIDIKTSDLKCDVNNEVQTINLLRKYDKNNSLSKDIQGGMYRYQGTDDVANWICFGVAKTEDCLGDIEKYMYRIIGITNAGQLYLLKQTFLQEEEEKTFAWNDEGKINDSVSDKCLDNKCPEWNNTDLFQRINGTSNGLKAGTGNNDDDIDDDTDIFVDSNKYDYLQSGDNVNGGSKASIWYDSIENHEWKYGDVTNSSYYGKPLYDIETGQVETNHYIQSPEELTTIVEEQYQWPETNKINAKISLMYIHDILFAYYDGKDDNTRGNPINEKNIKNSWIHFQKDSYNTNASYEWLSTRYGVGGLTSSGVYARTINTSGGISYHHLYREYGVRPVFYIKSSVKIADGDGTKENPYILDINKKI